MNNKKENNGINPIKYIKKGFWVWFGFLGAIISVLVGIFALILLLGLIFSAYNYISTKPQRDWERCWERENAIFHSKWDKLSPLPPFEAETDMKKASSIFDKRQKVRETLEIPSIICKKKGYKQFGKYRNGIGGELKVDG